MTAERLARLGAHSAGIGRKEVQGKRTETLALLFYVDRKQPVARLSAELVPETVAFFSRKEQREFKLPTDVIEMPQPVPEQDPETRIRPVPGGVSFGISGSTGTLGGWLWDTTDDTIVAVTNNHVLGNAIGADTLQQGTADGGSLPADKIGDVKRSVARIAPGTNLVDCAICDVDDADDVDQRVLEIGPGVYAVDTPVIDMQVEKYGQTTRHTFGEITDVDLETTSSDGFSFDRQLRIVPVDPSDDWSAGGDSGSLVFSQTPTSGDIKPAVGLHWGGSGVDGVACNIQNVFAALNLTTICGGLFSAFLDSLFDTEAEGELEANPKARPQSLAAAGPLAPLHPVAPLLVTSRARAQAGAQRFHRNISREMQARLESSERGRLVTEFVDVHRAELADLLLKDGDIRRSVVASLRPIVAGATTTTEVLKRSFTADDVKRLTALGEEVGRRSDTIGKRLGPLLRLAKNAEGKTPAGILGIEL